MRSHVLQEKNVKKFRYFANKTFQLFIYGISNILSNSNFSTLQFSPYKPLSVSQTSIYFHNFPLSWLDVLPNQTFP